VIPALLKSRSSRPCDATVSSTTSFTAAASRTSRPRASALPPDARIESATFAAPPPSTSVTTTSAPRAAMAPQLQEQLRRIGVRLELVRLDGPVWIQRRQRGEFDLDFSAATMDPAPSGVVQSWTCGGRGGSNLGQYCDPAVDSALDRAISSARGGEREWRAAYAALQNDAPALFLASPQTAFALHRRFRAVNLRPESLYSDLWRWSVDPGRRLPRDR
jgi:ABC-type transport system substrate-binding protein